jgi:hypothetical protein
VHEDLRHVFAEELTVYPLADRGEPLCLVGPETLVRFPDAIQQPLRREAFVVVGQRRIETGAVLVLAQVVAPVLLDDDQAIELARPVGARPALARIGLDAREAQHLVHESEVFFAQDAECNLRVFVQVAVLEKWSFRAHRVG